MSYPGSLRAARCFLARLGVAALGLTVGAGGLTLVAPAHAATIDGLEGAGTTADPIVIVSAADLDAAAAHVNGDHATYGSLAYRLGADIDYAGGTFATFQRFSGVFDGNAHAISDVTLRPGTVADTGDANATQTGFVQVLTDGTIKDLTLKRLTSVTTGGASARVQQGGFAGRSSGGTITGSALIDSTVRSSDNTDNSSSVGGFVGKTVGAASATTTVSGNLLSGTTVSGDKRVGGVVGWQNIAATVEDNLVVGASVAHKGASGAGAAFLAGHTVCVGALTGNVVVSGSIEQVSPAAYGWIRSAATGCTSSSNLVNANNDIDPSAPVGHTAAPDPNPYDVLWTGSTLLSTAGSWTSGDLGTYTAPAALAQQATYEVLGWDFAPGTGSWRWAEALGHPVPAHADLDGYDEISYLLGGGTNGANPSAYTPASADLALVAPTRAGYTFTGWTGTGLTEPTLQVTVPSGSSGDREYVAHWAATSYALDVDLAGGSVAQAAPSTYTIESDDISLETPTRPGHAFAGWTGTGLEEAAASVTIASGSSGHRAYTATWTAGFPISYDLAGGTATGTNPEAYLAGDAAIVLANPTRAGYTFAGWTGTDLVESTHTVTIPSGSTGARSYTATWRLDPAEIVGVSGSGTADSPYLVGSPADLDAVAAAVNSDPTTYGPRHVELTAHLDYGGATFAGFHRFSGVFDGAGHTISDLTYAPWVDGDTERIAFFARLDGATVTGLTLAGVTALKTGTTLAPGATSAVTAGLATLATSSTVDGVALLDATVRNESSEGENPYDAGFVSRIEGTEGAPTLVTNSMIGGDVTVFSAGKYVSAFVGYHGPHATLSKNLVAADPDAGHMSQNAAGGANQNAAVLVSYGGVGMDSQEIAGNVVYSGSVYSHATGTPGNTVSWIAGSNHTEIDTYGTNLVNADHNRTGFPTAAETAPEGHQLRWTRRSGNYAHDKAGLWVLGNDGTPASPEQLHDQSTYAGLGWDFESIWRWDAQSQHPVLRRAAASVEEPPAITVAATTTSYRVGSSPTAADVLARLGAVVDRGTLGIDLGGVDFATLGSYPATVTAADGEDVATPVAVTVVVTDLDGAGTQATPYVVASVSDLDAAAAMVNADPAQAGAAAAWFELAADIDYAGGTFATFRRFSGVLDGNGHTISDLTLAPGSVADTADAGATQTGFVQVLNGTIENLTLRELRSVTAGDTTARVQQGGFAGRAAGATITGSALMNATVRSSDNTDNSSAVGGLIGKSTGAGNTLADNLLAGVTVNGDKRVGGVIGWAQLESAVSRTLVLDTSVTQNGSSGAGAAFINGHTVCAGTVTGNVVLSGAIRQSSPAGYGWITTAATGCDATGNLVSANNNIDTTTPVGHTTVPTPNPYDVFWSGSTTLDTAGAWTRGNLGTYTSRDDLARQATYESLGWGFGAGAWRWDDERDHPVPAGVTFPSVELDLDLAGGTDGGANPATHGYALTTTLVNPTRAGYTFAGWTGPGLGGPTLDVRLPRYPTGALAYTATWTPTVYTVSYDLAGGEVGGDNPSTYTSESVAFTLANPTRAGYTFAGWAGTGVDGTRTAVTVVAGSAGSRSYTARWTPIGYRLSYDLAGGTAGGDNPASYTVESEAFILANPTRTGYVFAGWTGTDLTRATTTVVVAAGSPRERSYAATWTPVVYTIVYAVGDDADFTGPVPGTYTVESAAITLPSPARPGFEFAGWSGPDLAGPTMVVTIPRGSIGTRTYTPTWDRVHAIRYDLAGGTLAAGNPMSYTVKTAAFTLVNPTRPGYDFAGWAGLGATNPALTIPTGTTGDLVLTATWTKKAKARSTVRLTRVRKAERPRVEVAVRTVSGYAAPAGSVTVRVTGKVRKSVGGRTKKVRVTRIVRSTLRAGTATVTLPKRLPAGRYRITVRYAGDAFYAAGTSKALSYTYKK
ncbi:InlB B-repeat-containing protein [Nocardioides sp. W7]|uniref:InlB B-repeat-containing protein n=1 Tax=Nocardioides sp. W7 TaxID=2931390 RepID=UPI001FCF9AB4|nr:InlB B-repeat-containing protein [Nocardioides sp. W7]